MITTGQVWIYGLPVLVSLAECPRGSDDEKCYGTYDDEKLAIEVDANIPEEAQRAVLFHELGHAVWRRGPTRFAEQRVGEEAVVAMLETGLWAVLADPRNRWVVETLWPSGTTPGPHLSTACTPCTPPQA